MKNMRLLFIPLLVMALSFSACDDDRLLNPDPPLAITIDQAFTNAEIFQTYMNGIYDELSDGANMPRLVPWVDVRGGDALVIPTGNFSRYPIEYNFTETPNAAYGSDDQWFQAYDIIGLCNPALQALEDPDVPLTDDTKALFEAECRAFRALSYHNLIRIFAQPYAAGRDNLGVPLSLTPASPTDEPLPRATVGAVYDQMVADLVRAEAIMPATATDIFKWTRKSIQGVLARVYLDMGMWTEAAAMAEAALDGVTLMTAAEYQAGFDEATSEWLLGGGITADDNNGFVSIHSFWDTRRLGYSSLRLDMTFIDDNFTATDARGFPLLRVDGAGAPIVSTAYITNKWEHNTGFNQDEVYMRASEMYLIAAEAYARLGGANETRANELLFAIQSRADAAAVATNASGQALIDEVLLERRKELYAEGFRYFDLQRLQLDLERSAAGGHYANPLNIPFGDFRRLSPIPQFELDGNPNIRPQQNPGYGN
ncbi:MAG: RagB/SusD family nutrient uptake outer membrane protein [Bacteroidota bacterium]